MTPSPATYLDHAATTPMHPEAVAAMCAALSRLGNASSLHGAGRRARRVVEECRESIAEALGARPSEVLFTGGGTESDNLAVKGIYWARRAEDPRRRRVLVSAVEHHAVLDAADWLAEHEGAQVQVLPVDGAGRLRPDVLRAALAEDPGSVALVSVMWANNEVGTVQPVRELAEVAAAAGVPLHTDAVQAVAQLPVDFARSGAAALTLTGHKLGGPYGAGVLLLGRDVAATPLLHGGGQERDVRSGTLDVPAIVGLATAVRLAVAAQPALATRLAGLRDDLVSRVRAVVPDAVPNGDPGDGLVDGGPGRMPGNAHLTFPGCEGDSLLMLLDARGIECSTGAACTAGVAQPSHVLLAMGASPAAARGSLRFSLGSTSTPADVDAVVAAIGPVVERARGAGTRGARRAVAGAAGPGGGGAGGAGGGLDSAVAAARAVQAGHDVVGVHLALSTSPATLRTGSRGCCSREDAGDARRAADVLGVPFYVWDLAERFRADVVDDFVAEYAAGRTPNPCLRCNEHIKFAALLDRALDLGFDAVCTGHYARLSGGVLRRAVDLGKDQSYVLAVLAADQLAHALLPLGGTPKEEVRSEAARRGLAVADKPDSSDICFVPSGDTRAFLAERIGVRPGAVVDDATGEVLGRHDGVHGFTVGQRRGLGLSRPAADGRARFVLGVEPVSGTVRVGPGERLAVRRVEASRAVWTAGSAPDGPVECVAQVRAHGGTAPAVAEAVGDGVRVELREPVRGVAPGQAVALYRPDPAGDVVLGSATIDATR